MSDIINSRIWEELAEIVFGFDHEPVLQSILIERLRRLADNDDIDGAWEMLKELRGALV